jgi:hypothetical protein
LLIYPRFGECDLFLPHQINVANIDLRQWLPGQPFILSQGWSYDQITTDVVSVVDGNVLWLEGEPFF